VCSRRGGGGGGKKEIGILPAANEGETETPVCKTRFAGTQSVGNCRITVFVWFDGGGAAVVVVVEWKSKENSIIAGNFSSIAVCCAHKNKRKRPNVISGVVLCGRVWWSGG